MRKPKEITLAELVKSINIENLTRSKLILYLKYIRELDYNNKPPEPSRYVYDPSWPHQPRKLRVHQGVIEDFKREETDRLKKWLLDRNL